MVVGVDHTDRGPLELVHEHGHAVPEFSVRAGDPREQGVLPLGLEGLHQGPTGADGNVPVVGESSDGRQGVVAGRPDEDLDRSVDVEVDGRQRSVRLAALGIARLDLNRDARQEVGLVPGSGRSRTRSPVSSSSWSTGSPPRRVG